MEKNLSQLYQSLNQLTGLHRQLMDLVRAEREALVQADIKQIQDVTVAKQTVLESIRQCETRRMNEVAALAIEWKKPLRELTLNNIIIEVQGRDLKAAEQLRSTLNTLNILIQRITEQNRSNQSLVEKSLEHVGEMKRNILGEAETSAKTNTYNAQGQKAPSTQASRLVSKEA